MEGACQEAAPQGVPLEEWVGSGLVPNTKWTGMRRNRLQWDLRGAGRWGATPVADTCESEWWEKKLRNRGRGRDAEEGGGGTWHSLFSPRLSGPASFCDWSPTCNYSSALSKLKSTLFQVNNHSSGCLKWALTLRSKLPLEESLCLHVGSPWAKPMPESRTDPPVVEELGLLLETFRAFWVAFSSCLSVVPFGARLPELHFQPSRVASHSIISFLRASWLMTHIYSFSPTQICLTDVSFPWRLGREKCVLRC